MVREKILIWFQGQLRSRSSRLSTITLSVAIFEVSVIPLATDCKEISREPRQITSILTSYYNKNLKKSIPYIQSCSVNHYISPSCEI